MKRVVILGRGGAGKSTLARRLGAITGLSVTPLDEVFWQLGLEPTPPDEWRAVQEALVRGDAWILEGDLGPYDAVDVRLRAADTIILLDFPLLRCAWRTLRRGRERADYWRWVLAYRRRSRPVLLEAIAAHAPDAALHVLRGPGAVERYLARAASSPLRP